MPNPGLRSHPRGKEALMRVPDIGRPSPALVVACVALFVALGGTGYAALKLPKNSVGSKQIKKRAVRNSEIANNAVTGAKVRRGSLTASDFRASSLPSGPAGPPGPPWLSRAAASRGEHGLERGRVLRSTADRPSLRASPPPRPVAASLSSRSKATPGLTTTPRTHHPSRTRVCSDCATPPPP